MDIFKLTPSEVFTFIKNNVLVVVIAFIIFVLFIPIIIFSNLFPSQKNVTPQTTPTQPVPTSTSGSPTIFVSPTESIYQEQTARDSGYIELVKVEGDFDSDMKTETLADGSVKRTTQSVIPGRSNIVIVKNNAIIFMRYPVAGKEVSDGYKNLHGKQSHTLPGPTFYGKDTVIYFYENGGTALTVDPKTGVTYEEFTFQPPISVEEFNQKYKQYVN